MPAMPVTMSMPTWDEAHVSSACCSSDRPNMRPSPRSRSEEHTSELQSHHDLVCRLLLEKKKKKITTLSTPVKLIVAVIAYYFHHVNIQTVYLIMHVSSFT